MTLLESESGPRVGGVLVRRTRAFVAQREYERCHEPACSPLCPLDERRDPLLKAEGTERLEFDLTKVRVVRIKEHIKALGRDHGGDAQSDTSRLMYPGVAVRSGLNPVIDLEVVWRGLEERLIEVAAVEAVAPQARIDFPARQDF